MPWIARLFGRFLQRDRRDARHAVVSPQRPLYFWHIPKTAGTSTYQFLGDRFAAAAICPAGLWDQLVALPPDQAVSYGVYRGHFLGYLDGFLQKATIKITLLRELIERTISHFAEVRRTATHPYHPVVRSQTLLEFATSPETRHMVENFQARYLAASGDDIMALARQFSPADLAVFKLQTYLETLPLPPADTLYERARAALGGFAVVGTTKRFDETMQQVAAMLTLAPHRPFERRNASADRECVERLDGRTHEAIEAATRIDRRLYELARSGRWRALGAVLRRQG